MKKGLETLFKICCVFALIAIVLLFIVNPGTPEFIITIVTLAINVIAIVISAIIINKGRE